MNCYNDWADQFMNRAIDQVSGRLHEPMTMSEENAWVKKRRYHWNPDRSSSGSGYTFTFHWHNACTGEDRDMSEEDFKLFLFIGCLSGAIFVGSYFTTSVLIACFL